MYEFRLLVMFYLVLCNLDSENIPTVVKILMVKGIAYWVVEEHYNRPRNIE